MTKAPLAGQVKTRLSPPLRPEETAALNIAFLRDTAAAIEESCRHTSACGIGVFTPLGEAGVYENVLPTSFGLVPQRGEGFGERLKLALRDLLELGFASACLIDSDSPTLPAEIFRDAVELLGRAGDRMVIGPSFDGGYYLIGLKQRHRAVFERIDWSTERVFEQTIVRASEINLPVEQLPTWYDVDDRVMLRRLCDNLLGPDAAEHAPATKEFLERLIAREGRERIWPNESAQSTKVEK
jgi:rSAM/selenodomain-associated transferase 1